MSNSRRLRLWRVEWVHKDGYQAPYRMFEAESRKAAHTMAQQGTLVSRFPNSWSYRLILTQKILVNGKGWVDPIEDYLA